MDGSGRWAQSRGLPTTAGHAAGAEAVRRVVRAAPGLGIRVLTLYAFSSDNWRRPEPEVRALMRLLRAYLEEEAAACARAGVRVRVIGRRDRLHVALVEAIERAEAVTRAATRLELRIAVDYSARDTILEAARLAPDATWTRDSFAVALSAAMHAGAPGPDVDLVIRTAGEQRLSDFLIWESAYAEWWFTRTLWPDVGARTLASAVRAFRRRDRRYGGRPPAPLAESA